MDALSSEELRQLSYAELKQYAKRQGMKKTNMKAERLISTILSATARADETTESFDTCDESLDNSLLDLVQVPHEVSNIGNLSSRQRSRRTAHVFSEKMPEISFVPQEMSNKENTSSRRRSRRLIQMCSAESSPEGNNCSSEDSEIEIKTPVISIRNAKISPETADVTSMESKSSSEDSETELKTRSSILKRSGTFCVDVPVTPMDKQPKLNDLDLDVSASKQQSHKHRAASMKKVSIAPIAQPDFSDGQKEDTISEDQTYVVSAHLPTVTPAKTPRRSILRNGKKSMPLKSGSSKVNFITPDRVLRRRSNAETPLRSVKDRPKTPIAAKHSIKRKRFSSPFPEKSPKYTKTLNGQSTPTLSNNVTGETKIKLDKGLQTGTPMAKSVEKKPIAAATRIRGGRKELTTPSLSVKKNIPLELNKVITPNFKEIHQKAFAKMEDLEEYEKRMRNRMATLTRSQKRLRKEVPSSAKKSAQKKNPSREISNSANVLPSFKPSRIPQPFRGMPFIPAVKSIRKINTNFASNVKSQSFVHSTSKSIVGNENANPNRKCQRSLFTPVSDGGVFRFGRNQSEENPPSVANEKSTRKKFDLKASLAKKLPYKPYRGILRPLSDSNDNQSQLNASSMDHITQKREKSRDILKGVRKNRRFELQMSRRGIS